MNFRKIYSKKLILIVLALSLTLSVSACSNTKQPIQANTNQPEKRKEVTIIGDVDITSQKTAKQIREDYVNKHKEEIAEDNKKYKIVEATKTDCTDELDIECWNTFIHNGYNFELKYPKYYKGAEMYNDSIAGHCYSDDIYCFSFTIC